MNIRKQILLIEELETANNLIQLGLGEIQNLDYLNDFHFLPFQLLSQGIERFFKSYICLAYFNIHGEFPPAKYLSHDGHNLSRLLDKEIRLKYFTNIPSLQYEYDYDFLENSAELKGFLNIISEFGKFGRYYNFNVICGSDKPSDENPTNLWESFQRDLHVKNDNHLEWHNEIARHVVIIIEKLIAALSRQIIFNNLGSEAKRLGYLVATEFGFIYANEFSTSQSRKFGEKDYRKYTTRHKATEIRRHKRTSADEHERIHNPEYKSVKITKQDYDKEWPFYADEVIVECRKKHWCIITIDGYDYALNGAASSYYKLDFPHESGVAKVGMSMSDFLQIAFSL